jgi:hypothetical protein
MISIAHPLLGEEEEVAILRVRASNHLAYLAELDLFHEQSIAHARFLTADPSNFIQMPGSAYRAPLCSSPACHGSGCKEGFVTSNAPIAERGKSLNECQ